MLGVRATAPAIWILLAALGIVDRALGGGGGVVPGSEFNAPKHIGRLLRFFFFSFKVVSAWVLWDFAERTGEVTAEEGALSAMERR